MDKMTIPMRHQIFEKIKGKEGLTDKELSKLLVKDEVILTENEFNKILLDLEIMGLISVTWMTKDTKRIEVISIKEEEDEYEKQIKSSDEKDYEASFPGIDEK